MTRRPRGPSGMAMGLGVAAVALWPSCGGKSIRYEGEAGDSSESGGTGFGDDDSGGVSGTVGVGGVSVPQGGVGNAPNGGNGVGAGPAGGNAALGGVTGTGGVGVSGGGFSGTAGVFPTGGSGGISGSAGSAFGGFAGRGRGVGMGGRMGMGMGGRFGGAGIGGRFGGRGGFGGTSMGGFGANPMDGFTFLNPCGPPSSTTLTCNATQGGGCPGSTEPGLSGTHATDVTLSMPGLTGVYYDMLIHFQGILESKVYSSGVDQDAYAMSVPADGFYVGGVPSPDRATTFLVRVASPARDYFLNSISPPSMSSAPSQTFVVDYRGIIRVEGGTNVRLVSADSDCNILTNCGVRTSTGVCNPATIADLAPTIADDVGMQPYGGQFVGMVVERVTSIGP